MQIFIYLIGFLYLCVVVFLSFYGIHNLIITILYLQKGTPTKLKQTISPLKKWPRVTIQLPIFNEKYTIERLLSAVTQLNYPSDRLQIQVLDDSTDDTAELTHQLVIQHQARGVNIEWIHRDNRIGYKAGALHEGLRSASGEFLGIFDADFVPKRDWLKKTISLFKDRNLGCFQTRWGHTNRSYNSLTRAEALAIDGHFVVEQTARSQNDFFLNFNGTAGLWRRVCIEDAGGWQWDTLTEDLDLSYRAQMRGWKIGYTPDIVVPAELPSEVEAFKKQQFRWAKGSFQVVRKILPQVFKRSDLPWNVQLMAFLHLTGYFVHPLMLSILLLTLPVGLLIPETFKIFPISILAGIGSPLLYLTAVAPQTPSLIEKLKLMPLLVLTGFGISLSTTIAVVEGLTDNGGVFIRTPKLNLSNSRAQPKNIDRAYLPPINPMVWAEIALGVYAFLTIIILEPRLGWSITPWMMIYMLGYFYIAGLNLIQHNRLKDIFLMETAS
jgi:cellulose synthase/poly-beta-1,6-N-acetylglucosamine synthase-like glycosyltransferase